MSKQGHVEDLIQAFTKKAQIKDELEGGRIRIYEIHHHKFFRELTPNYPVLSINDYADVIAERVPEDEMAADDRDFIKVIHFQADPSRVHGIPFKFLLKEVRRRLPVGTCVTANARTRARYSPTRRSDWKSVRVSRARRLRRSSLPSCDVIKSQLT